MAARRRGSGRRKVGRKKRRNTHEDSSPEIKRPLGQMVLPPSTTTTCPVMSVVPSARNSTTSATSSGVAAQVQRSLCDRLIHVLLVTHQPAGTNRPGATALTRTSGAKALARDCVMQFIAALLAE